MDVGSFLGGIGTAAVGFVVWWLKQRYSLTHLKEKRAITHEEHKENLQMAGQILELKHKHNESIDEILAVMELVQKIKAGPNPGETDQLIEQLGQLMNLMLYQHHETARYIEIFGAADEGDLRIRLAYLTKIADGKKLVATMRKALLPFTFARDSMEYFDSFPMAQVWSDFQHLASIPEMQELCQSVMGLMQQTMELEATNAPTLSPPTSP